MQLSVRATGLADLLDQAPPGIECLSLACFDTLLWRNLHQPTDLFADLDIADGPKLRSLAERRARTVAHFARDSNEVTLDDIYTAMLPPAADSAWRAAAIATELAAEANHCFGFAPARDLLLAAKARGLQIILVSDTPLAETELRALIAAAVGEEVLGLIDHIFCSSAYGVGKSGGLFTHVLVELGLSPSAILHVGDSPIADGDAPARLGIHSAYLVRFDTDSSQRLRLEAAAAALIDPAAGWIMPIHQPHRAAIALRSADDPAWVLGHDVLGPSMYSFAGWLHEQAEALAARTGKPPRLLFLLPDGHLLAQALLARYPDWADRMIQAEISSFTAWAASFSDDAAIAEYLYPNLSRLPPAALARQLGFSPEEIDKLPRNLAPKDFRDTVMRPACRNRIRQRSSDFAERLTACLRQQGVQPGDAVMLIASDDRNGMQDRLDPVLRHRLNLEIAGRYLLLSGTRQSGLDKEGLFSVRHYDPRLLDGLQATGVIEALCVGARNSVIDYRQDGTPVREGPEGKPDPLRDRLQAACVAYIAQAGRGFVRPPQSDTPDTRRQAAAAALVRLAYLPLAGETALLESLRRDAGHPVPQRDPETIGKNLRRYGSFSAEEDDRRVLPDAMQYCDLPSRLTDFAMQRFSLDLRQRDFATGTVKLPVQPSLQSVDAVPTQDGFYAATLPVTVIDGPIGLSFGHLYDIVQIEHIGFSDARRRLQPTLAARPVFEQMEELAPGLFRTGGDAGLLRIPPPDPAPKGMPLLLTVVFRPVVLRQQVATARQAA